MELNYHQVLFNKINLVYLNLRTEYDFPWSVEAQNFLRLNRNVKNLAELDQLINHLETLNQTFERDAELYNTDLINTFEAQRRTILQAKKVLSLLYNQFQTWLIFYDASTLDKFDQLIIETFETYLTYLDLNFVNLLEATKSTKLVNYLITTKNDLTKSDVKDSLAIISEFYFKVNNFLPEWKDTINELTTSKTEFFVFLKDFGLMLNLLLTLYYSWLSTNQIIDLNTTKFASFYLS